MRHCCGVLGMVTARSPLRAQSVVRTLHALQHRGYESAGLAYASSALGAPAHLTVDKGIGLVRKVFPKDTYTWAQQVTHAIGHVRYSTVSKQPSMEAQLAESQPLQAQTASGITFAVAHNGNVPNMRAVCERFHLVLDFNSDTVAIVACLKALFDKHGSWYKAFANFLEHVAGSYCLVIATPNAVYAMRDRYGIRPLYLLEDSEGVMVASESVAFGARRQSQGCSMRPVQPGEVVQLTPGAKAHTLYQHPSLPPQAFCSFESIYFMHYQSELKGDTRVANVRYALGKALGEAEHHPLPKDALVVGVPKTSIPAAQGYAEAVGRPFAQTLLQRNTGVMRTFILPTKQQRQQACDRKFVYDAARIQGATIYLIDDSIVRGTTMHSVVARLRTYGAAAVHVRVPSPIIRAPCYFGIDMATREEMVSYPNRDAAAIGKQLGVDSLRYLALDTLKVILGKNSTVCTSCFTGKYNKDLFDW